MSDENETEAPATAQTIAEGVPQQNTAARAAIGEALARQRAAAPGRPPRNPKVDNGGPIAEPIGTDTAPAAATAKRKKPSGKKKTRKELVELVKQYQRGEIATAAPREKAPADSPAAAASLVAGDPIAKEKFAKGVGRFCGAVSRFVSRRRGVHWQFDDIECGALGEAAADCLEAGEEMAPALTPWLQKSMALAPFAVLAGVLYEVVDTRLEIDEKIAAGEKAKVMPGAPTSTAVRVMP